MNPQHTSLTQMIEEKLWSYNKDVRPLPGLKSRTNGRLFLTYLAEALEEVRSMVILKQNVVNGNGMSHKNSAFDPLTLAVLQQQQGNDEEAWWLVFLAAYFGKHKKTVWALLQGVYTALDTSIQWTWENTYLNKKLFDQWINDNQEFLRKLGSFGEQHKYQTLDVHKTAKVVADINSYIDWVQQNGSHKEILNNAVRQVGSKPGDLFHYLYLSIDKGTHLTRPLKFEYLTLIGKLGLADIEPVDAYLMELPALKKGARWLFIGNEDANIGVKELNQSLKDLAQYLDFYYGIQVLEDALRRISNARNYG